MDEKEVRKFFKEFAMYVNLPVPKVIINGETKASFTVAEDESIVQNEILFEIGKESNRWDRIQYVSNILSGIIPNLFKTTYKAKEACPLDNMNRGLSVFCKIISFKSIILPYRTYITSRTDKDDAI